MTQIFWNCHGISGRLRKKSFRLMISSFICLMDPFFSLVWVKIMVRRVDNVYSKNSKICKTRHQ